MNQYSVLVFLHVASVIVWLGAGTTLALLTLYALRAGDDAILERLGAVTGWLAPRVFAPSALAALGFGVAAAHSGHWPRMFFFHIGEAAFAVTFLTTVAFRLPLMRRALRGDESLLATWDGARTIYQRPAAEPTEASTTTVTASSTPTCSTLSLAASGCWAASRASRCR